MYYFILNPTAGNGRSIKIMQQVKDILEIKRTKYQIVQTEYPGHATLIARDAIQNGYKSIIAVGGDGTILEVANGMIGENATMGIIPAGTGNDFIKTIGIPNDPEVATDILFKNNHKQVDIGIADERYFLNVSGAGFDVEVLKNTEKVKSFLTGLAAYYTAVFMAIFGYKFKKIIIKTVDRTIIREVLLIAVANGIAFGGGMKVAPEASIEDGLLNVTIVNKMPRWRIPIELPKFIKGDHEKLDKYMEKFKCESVTIETEEAEPLDMDGEILGSTPVTFKVIKNAIDVFTP